MFVKAIRVGTIPLKWVVGQVSSLDREERDAETQGGRGRVTNVLIVRVPNRNAIAGNGLCLGVPSTQRGLNCYPVFQLHPEGLEQ